jgi:excisionase family DNA binding protein
MLDSERCMETTLDTPGTEGLLRPSTIAKLLDVSEIHVRRMIQRGALDSVLVGRCRRVPIASVMRAVREGLEVPRGAA